MAEHLDDSSIDSSDSETDSSSDEDSVCGDPGPTIAPSGSSVGQTLLIFDWDDTILPSTWIRKSHLRLDEDCRPTEGQKHQLSEVAEVAAKTLKMPKKHSIVVLVTNAERGWIELSCRKLLPTLWPTLENIKIISARSTYDDGNSAFEWKNRAFEAEIWPEHYNWGNVISLGDSAHEREALIRSTQRMQCRTESLKYVERPEIEQLLRELKLLACCIDEIVCHDGNLDLCIQCA